MGTKYCLGQKHFSGQTLLALHAYLPAPTCLRKLLGSLFFTSAVGFSPLKHLTGGIQRAKPWAILVKVIGFSTGTPRLSILWLGHRW